MTQLTRILAITISMFFLTSCTIAGVNVPVPTTTSTETSGDPLLSDAGIDKYNAYIGYLNNQDSIYKALGYYLRDVDEETGMPKTKGSVTSLWSLVPDYTMQKVETAMKQKPAFPEVDTDFQALIPAYKAMEVAYDKLDTYYRTKEYLTDDYKKIPTMHAEFLTAYDVFYPIDVRVSSGMLVLEDRVEANRLESLKADGLKVMYAKEVFIRSSRMAINYVSTYDAHSIGEIDKVKLDTMLATIGTDYEAYLTAASDKAQVAKEIGGYSLNMFNSSAEKFLSQIRTLASALGNPSEQKNIIKQVELHFNNASNISGTPEKALSEFNNMINASNMMNR